MKKTSNLFCLLLIVGCIPIEPDTTLKPSSSSESKSTLVAKIKGNSKPKENVKSKEEAKAKRVANWDNFTRKLDAVSVALGNESVYGLDSLGGNTQNGSVTSGGPSTPLSQIKLGAKPTSVSLTAGCGLPTSNTTENNRRAWYNEAAKNGVSVPFQTSVSAKKQILSLSVPSGYSSLCEAAKAQVHAFLPSLNQAINASNKIHNGPPIGFKCISSKGAAHTTACTSVEIVYGLKTASYQCHEACKAGR